MSPYRCIGRLTKGGIGGNHFNDFDKWNQVKQDAFASILIASLIWMKELLKASPGYL